MAAAIILPHQLFWNSLEGERYLVEAPRFFTDFNFHKQKLVLHRASMKAYQEQKDIDSYLEFDEPWKQIFGKHEKVRLHDPVDHELRKRLENAAEQHEVELEILETPMFIESMDWNRSFFRDHDYFHLEYYKAVRKKHDILVEDGNPVGGKWSFDPENRQKMPEDIEKPEIPGFESEHVEKAREYVDQNFPDNPGSLEKFFWPVTREQALTNLEDFLENRLEKFGDYQDAIDRDLRYGFHSLLSSSLNTGLITSEEVVDKTLRAHEKREYPMNSLEGFLRQVVGWREFVRAIYELEADEMRSSSFFGCENPMPGEFYNRGTGLPPVDTSIGNALENGYCHHIERLMVLGNVMLLLEIDPEEVYQWFMELFIDSYDWVMVPNIYGMSQYSYEEMMTKPYISGSNYIREMSHYSGGDWEDYWDGLYWSFIEKHREKIENIQRMSFMASMLDRMDEETLNEHRKNAEKFCEQLSELD